MMRVTRRRALCGLGTAGFATIAGCVGDLGDDGDGESDEPDEPSESEDGDGGDEPADGDDAANGPPLATESLPLPMSGEALRSESRSGGPPKDGIPSIDDPKFIDAGDADDTLDDGDVVFGLARGGEAKAYPQGVLVWHEIVNDAIDGDPVSVTYCPLTGTVQGFDRGDTTFGVSGRLLNSNLIMYDRVTENWWPQVLASAIPGPWSSSLQGKTLSEFRVIWTTWGRWKDRHPETQVLSNETGFARNYSQDPYGQYNPADGYYTSDSTLFPPLHRDDQFSMKHVVMGVRSPDGAAAVSKEVLREEGLIEGEIDGSALFWVYEPGLDTGYAYWNPDGEEYAYEGGEVAGPDGQFDPAELPLDPALTFDGMWFAWFGFYPELTVHG